MVGWVLKTYALLEVEFVAVERVMAYTALDGELATVGDHKRHHFPCLKMNAMSSFCCLYFLAFCYVYIIMVRTYFIV